jgi:nitrite reductase/ring-hydroxylating ferredoxin subunit
VVASNRMNVSRNDRTAPAENAILVFWIDTVRGREPGGRFTTFRRNRRMADYVEFMRPCRIMPGTGVRIAIAEHFAVALFEVGDRVCAIDDLCVRCGKSLAQGTLRGTIVSCCGCDWRYDITNGRVNDIPALRIDTFETKVVDSRILIATTASP